MSEFDSIEEELKFMADCSDDRGDSETSLMFVRYLAHIRKLNAELAALKAGQGEAVAIAECREVHGHMCQFLNRTQHGMDTLRDGDKLYAAPPASADARSVPVELMELEWLEGWLRFAAEPIGQECCGRGGQECCGCPDPVYPGLEDVGRAMDERAKELRALLARSE